MASRTAEKLVREVADWPGWRVRDIRHGWMLFPVDTTYQPIVVHSGDSDPRAAKNTRARLRAAGGPV